MAKVPKLSRYAEFLRPFCGFGIPRAAGVTVSLLAVLFALQTGCATSSGDQEDGRERSREVKQASRRQAGDDESNGSKRSKDDSPSTASAREVMVTLANESAFAGSIPQQVLTDTLVAMEELVRKNSKDLNVLVTYLGLLRMHGQSGKIYESVLRQAGGIGAANPWFLLEAGFGALNSKNFALAEYLFVKAQRNAGNDRAARDAITHALGVSFLVQGKVQQAVFEMKKAASEGEPHLPSVLTLGYLALRFGDYTGAERSFRVAMARAPENLNSVVGLAATLRATGKAKEAIPLIKGAYSRNKKDRRLAWNLALTLSEVPGNEKEALAVLDRYFQLPGSLPDIDPKATVLANKLDAKLRS